jgi:hypothetical protein
MLIQTTKSKVTNIERGNRGEERYVLLNVTGHRSCRANTGHKKLRKTL